MYNYVKLHYFLLTYFLVIAGFFFIPSAKWNNNMNYVLLVAPYLLTIKRRQILDCFSSNIFIFFIMLSGYLLLTLVWTEGANTRGYIKSIFHFLTICIFICVTTELMNTYTGFKDKLFLFLCLAGTIGGIVYFFILYPELTFPPITIQNIGALNNSIQIGNVYGMIFIIIYYNFYKRNSHFNKKMFYLLLSIIILFIVILTQSRGAILSLIIAFFIGSILTKDKKIILVLISISIGVTFIISNLFTNRFHEWLYFIIFIRKDSERLEIFRVTLSRIFESTFTFFCGHGILTNTRIALSSGVVDAHPHSLYLTTWLYGGIIGLILLLIMLIACLKQSIKYFLEQEDVLFVTLLTYSYFCVFTNYPNVVDHPTPLILFFWLPISLLCTYEINKRMNKTVSILNTHG